MNAETIEKIRKERERQVAKWGSGQFRSVPDERVLAVLVEEVGELAKAILEMSSIEEEIIHVAAVAAGWLDECFSSGE
jgi:NTP pyrophosphatase (non-canonical NTP hydrolase)